MNFDFSQTLILEDLRTRLEPLEEKHFDLLLPVALQEPDLLKYSPSPFGTAEKMKEYFHLAHNQRAAEKRYAFVIFDKLRGKYAGSTSIRRDIKQGPQIATGMDLDGK